MRHRAYGYWAEDAKQPQIALLAGSGTADTVERRCRPAFVQADLGLRRSISDRAAWVSGSLRPPGHDRSINDPLEYREIEGLADEVEGAAVE